MPNDTAPAAPMPDRAGLTAAEVRAARARHGWNELPRAARTPAVAVFVRQFTGLLVLILIAAAVIALALGETVDAVAIGAIVILNGILGFVQEWRAETALEALQAMMSPHALVVRDGQETVIPARELVPGDYVILTAGDSVPADLRLTKGADLRIDESVLTGESVPVAKEPGAEVGQVERQDAASGTALGQAFSGTAVALGRGEGVVTAIGAATAFGRIADLTGGIDTKTTHLQVQLGRLAKQLAIAATGIGAAIVAAGVLTGRPPVEMFLTGISLAVAMVPEGLPAVVTITLALGASAMVRQNALARRLQAVETLGAASVICTDKTGTLTENKMTATRVWMPDAVYEVTGTGYDPTGHIACDGVRVRAEDDADLARLLTTAVTCNHAGLTHRGTGWTMTGAPTEGALVTLAYKGWVAPLDPDALLAELPFTSERKRMSVLARAADGGDILHTKGAPERILEICTHLWRDGRRLALDPAARRAIRDAYSAMAADGLRVIALAQRAADRADLDTELRETDLTFLGLVGLIDPPRAEVRQAIADAHAAGIRVVMITGDSPITAQAIAEALGMGTPDTITGPEVDALSDADLAARLTGDVLFARTMPAHKMRIVAALQAQRQIVAMTGDGVNDAPALKRADIGVAMGIRGTDVSKGAADLVLLDDNFATIIRAIAEGRRQFDNIRKFVRYLLASNAGEVLAIVVNLIVGGPLIFLATQILWMNLITDGVTAVALGLERADKDQMARGPRKKSEPLMGSQGLATILAFGCYTATASLYLFYTLLPLGVDLARTAAFTGMVVFEKASVFAFRSLTLPTTRIGWFSNRVLILALIAMLGLQGLAVYWTPLGTMLHAVPLAAGHWALIGALAVPLILVPEAVKAWRSRGRGLGRAV